MGTGQCDTISHARLLRPQPQPHQRPMRAAIRPNDTGGALRPCQHRRRQLAALHIQGNRDAPYGCGSGKLGGIGQRLYKLAHAARRHPLVSEIGRAQDCQQHPFRQAHL